MLIRLSAQRRTYPLTVMGLVILIALAAALAAPAARAALAPAELAGSINWASGPQQITSGSANKVYAWVAVDSSNKTHIVYTPREDGVILYTNNVAGSFSTTKRIDTVYNPGKILYSPVPPAIIAVGTDNIIRVVYGRINVDNHIYYKQSSDNGNTWSDRERISEGDDKASAPHMFIDPATNDTHIVWIDIRNGCSSYNVYYRIRYANGQLSGISKPKNECGTYQNRPSVTFANGKPHVVFQRESDIYYARLEGGDWVSQNLSNSNNINSQNPTLASDGGSNLFMAWDENVGGHDIWFKTSSNGGLTWSAPLKFSDNKVLSTQPYVTWSKTTKRAYIVWSDQNGSDDGLEEIWEREFDPNTQQTTAPDRISHFNGHSYWPTIAVGTERADITWHDNRGGPYQIWDWAGVVTAAAGCDGSLLLNGGIAATKDSTLIGAITPSSGCVPDQMQYSLDTPPTDATAKLTYSANFTMPNVPGDACTHTVYVRLFKNGVGGKIFSDSINVDSVVDADVRATNPYLIGLPTFSDLLGSIGGDPRYTRKVNFFLSINNAGDCTGLTSFDIPNVGSGAITNGSYTGTPNLPSATPGPQQFIVNVTDAIGNKDAFPRTLVYDPTPPTLVTTGSPTVTARISSTSIVVPLSFDNIHVNDNLYGDGTGPGTSDFWGVWVAVSRTNAAPTDLTKWFAKEVSNPDATFTIDWSLFTGLGSAERQPGDYYVFVKFLDGAGNPTAATLQVAKIHLEQNFTVPKLYLPHVAK